jgi:hypothetical protein
MSDLLQRSDLRVTQMISSAPEIATKVGTALYQQLAGRMPAAIAQERIVTLAQTSLHLCADRSRVEDDPDGTRVHLPGTMFVENVVDMVCGAMFAPYTEVAETDPIEPDTAPPTL